MKLHTLIAAVMLTAAGTAVTLTAATAVGAVTVAQQLALPADDAAAKVRLSESSRHGEYVDITAPGRSTPLRAFVVYPEIATKASVVIVLHETYGLTDWIRGVADQLAADGFIAIAPDLLSGKAPNGGDSTKFASRNEAIKAAASLTGDEIKSALAVVRAYGAKLPAATGKTVTLGFGVDGAAFDLRGEADVEAASRAWPATLASLRQQAR